jgi:arsenite methyltransferase
MLTTDRLAPIRDRILDVVEPLDGATLLDVGTGDGLIGLAALDRVGAAGTVIFSDISQPLLDECAACVASCAAIGRATFVLADSASLEAIDDQSVDVITTRSVLIYVADKPAAFAAFRRVLRPGGRISLFEPINRLMYPEPPGRFYGYDLSSVSELVDKVHASFDDATDATSQEAMMGFDDRDLADLAQQAGFTGVHVECHIDITPGLVRSVSLQALLDGAPNPNAPTVQEAISTSLTEDEQKRFIDALGRAFGTTKPIERLAVAYVNASL